VRIQPDHKPLVSIWKKNLVNAPPRIARMILRIQKYNIDLIYVLGRDLQLADALSRVSPRSGREIPGLRISVHDPLLPTSVLQFKLLPPPPQVVPPLASPSPPQHFRISVHEIAQIKEATAVDPQLRPLIRMIADGWPEKRAQCPALLHPFGNYRDELGVEDGMILKGSNIVISKSLQSDVLEQLHFAHQGVEKCTLRARASVFWVGIHEDIKRMVGKCAQCQHNKPQQQAEPLMPHDVPQRPWHTLGTDLFHLNGHNYLLVADYYSKFPIVKKMTTTSSAVVVHMKSIFSEFGIPAKLISDNRPQYALEEFRKFVDSYGIRH
jgi:hypothetical protein